MNVAQLRVTQKLNEYEFGAELRLLRDFPNNNKWDYQNIDKYYQTFLGRPILIAYVNGRIGLGHEMKEKRDANGELYYSFTDGTSERIIGTISEDPNDIWLEKEGKYTWIVARGKLFTFYAKEVVDSIIAKGSYEVSVETEVLESHMDGDIDVFTKWVGIGVTLLGSGVAPAVPGANIKKLQALESEFSELKLRAASLIKSAEGNEGEGDAGKGEGEEGIVDPDDPNEPEEPDEPDDPDDPDEPDDPDGIVDEGDDLGDEGKPSEDE